MAISRRDFLKTVGATGVAVATAPMLARGSEVENPNDPEFFGLLIDTTMCVGCRSCEEACNAANNLPKPEKSFSDTTIFSERRDTTPSAYKVVNQFPNANDPANPIYVPKQCLHCNQPACATACLTKALEKQKEGPVTYTKGRCMGCRYCMVSCPFEVPKFNYDSPMPTINKCILCFDKIKEGKQPACAENCPTGATKFGTRRELLQEARQRVYSDPKKYHNHIYGENEVGGTGVMYLSSVPFEKLGFKTNLGSKPYPQYTQGFLTSVPLVFVLWPSVLLGINAVVKGNPEAAKSVKARLTQEENKHE